MNETLDAAIGAQSSVNLEGPRQQFEGVPTVDAPAEAMPAESATEDQHKEPQQERSEPFDIVVADSSRKGWQLVVRGLHMVRVRAPEKSDPSP